MLKLLFPVLLLFASVPAFACRCGGPPPPDQSYANASAVFIARITTLKPGEFRITRGKSWKGNAPAEFVVPRGACSMENVQSGAEYIVYAPEGLRLHMCSRMQLLPQSRIEAQHLDALQAGRKPDLAAGLSASLTTAPDASVRAEAARLMDEIMRYDRSGASATAFGAAILQGTKDRSAEVRLAVVQALDALPARGRLDARLAALVDTDPAVRAAAVEISSIKGDGVLFRALVTALQRTRTEPNPDAAAQETLLHAFARQLPGAAVTEADKDQAEELLRGLIAEIKEPWKRVAPVQELGMMGARAREAAPQLLQVLKTTDHYSLKETTILALADLGATEMRDDIEPYLKDEHCSVVGAVVQALWKMNKEGFDRFFVEKGMPEMNRRFDDCATLFVFALQNIVPAGRELEPVVAARYAAMADSLGTKDSVKRLLDSWRAAP
jgi:hypothetical protein